MSYEIHWNGVLENEYDSYAMYCPLWKLCLKSDHLVSFHISLLIPKSIDKNHVDSTQCWLLDKPFDRSRVDIHTTKSFAPWLDKIQRKIRNRYPFKNTIFNEWKFSFEFDFKRIGIYHTLFHLTNTKNQHKNKKQSKFNFDTNTMDKQTFIKQCYVHKVDRLDLRQQTKKIDINQDNEITFQLKLKIPQLLNEYRSHMYNLIGDSFYLWIEAIRIIQERTHNNSNDNPNNNGEDDMIILNYCTNNVFIGFNSLMLYYEKIRTIITDIFIFESGNIGVENSIIDILFKYISFDDIHDDKKSNMIMSHVDYNSTSKNGNYKMSLKKYGFDSGGNLNHEKNMPTSFETKNKIITIDQSSYDHDRDWYYPIRYFFESCLLKHSQLNVIFNNWILVGDHRVYHKIINKNTKQKLIIPKNENEYYDYVHNDYFAKDVQRICNGHKYVNCYYSLNKCIKNEWILNREFLVRCFWNFTNSYDYKHIILLNNGYSEKLKYCRRGNNNCNQINYKLCTDMVLKTSLKNQIDCRKIKDYFDKKTGTFYKHGCNANKKSCKKIYVKSCRIRKAKFENRRRHKKNKVHKKYKNSEKYKYFVFQQELNDTLQMV